MRAERLGLLAIVALSLAIGSARLTRGHEWGDDFASYVMQAQAIVHGTTGAFIEHNSFTIRESSFPIGAVAYPWGYPLILSPAVAAKGLDPMALKVPGLLCFAGFLLCLHWMTKERLPSAERLLLVAIFAFSPVLTKFLDHVLSDVPYLLFTWLGLAWIERRGRGVWNSAGLGSIIFLTCFVRATGIIMLGSYLAQQAICFVRQPEGRRSRVVDSVVVVASLGLLWALSALVFTGAQGYDKPLQGLTLGTVKLNRGYYFAIFGSFLGGGTAWTAVYYVLIALFLIGLWTRRSSDRHLAIFFGLYLAMVLVVPMRNGIRYVLPLLPIFIYMAFQGARALVDWLPKDRQRVGRLLFGGAWLVLVGFFLAGSAAGAQANLRAGRQVEGPFDPISQELFDYIRTETPEGSVIVFFKPRALRLFVPRDSVLIFNCQRLTVGDYVVLSKKPEVGQVRADRIDQCKIPLRNVWENERFVVYQLPRT